MDKKKKEKFRRWLGIRLERITKYQEKIDSKGYLTIEGSCYTPEQIKRNYLEMVADDSLAAAKYSLALSWKAEALKYLNQSVEYYEKTLPMNIEMKKTAAYVILWTSLAAAIVNGNESSMKRIANLLAGTDLSFAGLYELMDAYLRVQCGFILDDSEAVEKHLEDLKRYEPTWKKYGDYEG